MDATLSFRIDANSSSKPHFAVPLPSVTLEIQRGKARELTRTVTPPVFLIGSALDSDLVLGDANFPEAYAYLYVKTDGIFLQYLGDGPEITVEGIRGETFRLENGQRIEAGPFEFIIRIEAGRPGRKEEVPVEDSSWDSPLAGNSEDWFDFGSAIDEVRSLVSDVRSQLKLPASTLRLFVGPEGAESDSSSKRSVA